MHYYENTRSALALIAHLESPHTLSAALEVVRELEGAVGAILSAATHPLLREIGEVRLALEGRSEEIAATSPAAARSVETMKRASASRSARTPLVPGGLGGNRSR